MKNTDITRENETLLKFLAVKQSLPLSPNCSESQYLDYTFDTPS